MRNLRDIRKRIVSIRGTQKLTRAMKLVAGAKLRKAQDNLIKARPYAEMTIEAASRAAARLESDRHPLLARRGEKSVLILILTSDKGLCGSFNANVLRGSERFIADRRAKGVEVKLAAIGRKGINYFKARRVPLVKEFTGFYDSLKFEKATDLAQWVIHEYTTGGVDGVYLVYNEFKSAVAQKVVMEQALPVNPAVLEGTYKDVDYLFEPDEASLLDHLLGMYVATEVYRSLYESVASEHGARMSAMDNATRNADELLRSMTLEYNKARQGSITKELLEIVAGAEAQKGG